MLSKDIGLNAKSISRLTGKGLAVRTLTDQLSQDLDLSLELWKAQGVNVIKKYGYYYFDTAFIPIDSKKGRKNNLFKRRKNN